MDNLIKPAIQGNGAGRNDELDETNKLRWFGQVTDLIDAASALSGLPSFSLVRVRDANGEISQDAWRKEYSQLRDRIVSKALTARWTRDLWQMHQVGRLSDQMLWRKAL